MKGQAQIFHRGKIISIEGSRILVSIRSDSACGTCQVKGACSMAESEDKVIEVTDLYFEDYEVGEEVEVYFSQSLGFRALFLGYFLPFLLVLVSLIILIIQTGNELLSGLLSLGLLVPYYLILYVSRRKIKKRFSFQLRKIM